MEKRKVKIYIDGANMFYTQKRLGWSVDWKKVKEFLEQQKDVIEWRYYVGVKADDEKMLKYLKYLNSVGFNTITKPLKKIKIGEVEVSSQDSESKFIYKANFDVEMTADILLEKFKLDEIIIFSGDSDFKYLVKKLRDSGLEVSIFSSRKTISWELKLECSKVFYFESLKNEIKRE